MSKELRAVVVYMMKMVLRRMMKTVALGMLTMAGHTQRMEEDRMLMGMAEHWPKTVEECILSGYSRHMMKPAVDGR